MRAKQSKRGGERGSALIEISLSYATLVIVALLTLKASVNASSSQSWTVKQAMTDAYITRETALASRIPYSEITGASSLWAIQPAVTTDSPSGENVARISEPFSGSFRPIGMKSPEPSAATSPSWTPSTIATN